MRQQHQGVNIIVGFFMLLVLFALLFISLQVTGITNGVAGKKSFLVTAQFSDIGSLKPKAPVTVAGVKVGEITAIKLEPNSLVANVTMALDASNKIPYQDVSARILTQGILGANYISIVPGFDDPDSRHPFLKNGDIIEKTQEAMILENLIGQLIFNIKK